MHSLCHSLFTVCDPCSTDPKQNRKKEGKGMTHLIGLLCWYRYPYAKRINTETLVSEQQRSKKQNTLWCADYVNGCQTRQKLRLLTCCKAINPRRPTRAAANCVFYFRIKTHGGAWIMHTYSIQWNQQTCARTCSGGRNYSLTPYLLFAWSTGTLGLIWICCSQ